MSKIYMQANSEPGSQSFMGGARDAVSAVAMQAAKDAQKTRQEARKLRDDERRKQVKLMRNAAEKLRQAAKAVLHGTILQGSIGGLSLAGSVGGRFVGTENSSTGKQIFDVAASLERIRGVNPFEISKAQREYEQKNLEADASEAGKEADYEADRYSDANRLQGAMAQKLEKASDLKHRIEQEAVRLGR